MNETLQADMEWYEAEATSKVAYTESLEAFDLNASVGCLVRNS